MRKELFDTEITGSKRFDQRVDGVEPPADEESISGWIIEYMIERRTSDTTLTTLFTRHS